MEELKLLIEMVSNLPTMAVWVLVGFFAYKVTIIGSVYGTIKLAINKFHGYLTTPKHELIKKTIDIEATLDKICITREWEGLAQQIRRLRGVRSSSAEYIHGNDIDWLREAIDLKIDTEKKAQ